MDPNNAEEPLLPIADPRSAGNVAATGKKVKGAWIWIPPMAIFAAFVIYETLNFSSSGRSSRDFQNQMITLEVQADDSGRPIPSTLFGIFFEEINHAGAGGLWAELINNRGFEAGGQNTPSNIDPWYQKGDSNNVILSTERTSLFKRNPIALRISTLCGSASNPCPAGGVGVINPGYWGIDVRAGKFYTVTFWLRSDTSVNLTVKFISEDEQRTLAQQALTVDKVKSNSWAKYSFRLAATDTDHHGKLAFTTAVQGSIWLDQVSAFPEETYKGHGFRTELAKMLEDLKPAFIRFPGGCYVEGERLENAWRWRDTVGPWQERPGHMGDVWNYWSDDGLGYFEFLQLAEDLAAAPVWVFNNGISHQYSVNPQLIQPWVKDVLDGIEFARGPNTSQWGAVRASMGHPDPFPLKHIAIGNEDCWKPWYRENYMAFYNAIKAAYPDIKLISNCDATNGPLNHPADYYDFHVYTSASNLYAMAHEFDQKSRADGPKVFVSEYAVTGGDAGTGSLLAAVAEGAFMIGLEINSDVVEMASYAPLFVHTNDRRWMPDAIVLDSWQQYGTPSYWVQQLFKYSSGATLLPFSILSSWASNPVVSVLRRHDKDLNADFLVVKAVNFGNVVVPLQITFSGLAANDILYTNSTIATLTSAGTMDENSFAQPKKIAPQISPVAAPKTNSNLQVVLPAHSIVALDLRLAHTTKGVDSPSLI
ncbi:hypothetical protein R1sor_021959 [Riccia sorocarpa]|uniref:non-reducing end alpha-L-arabinofuranosidase n=1 Tax=Riccia sorocarpa TaxID=122646 RepID=A0ABD3GII1_9MARC